MLRQIGVNEIALASKANRAQCGDRTHDVLHSTYIIHGLCSGERKIVAKTLSIVRQQSRAARAAAESQQRLEPDSPLSVPPIEPDRRQGGVRVGERR